jgi:hypothetical protein
MQGFIFGRIRGQGHVMKALREIRGGMLTKRRKNRNINLKNKKP